MRTETEIREKKEADLQFIISAVTSELHDIAYLKYFTAWEHNGGMRWFFDECVDITKEIMLAEGSEYMKWLDYWKDTSGEDFEWFTEFSGESFDWYHMNEARHLFESRYKEDDCTKRQVSESIGYLINSFEDEADRDEVTAMAIKFANKGIETKKLRKIIQDLKDINANADTMETISKKLGI